MYSRWYQLVIDVVVGKEHFEFFAGFIVKSMQSWFVAGFAEAIVCNSKCIGEVVGCPCFEGFNKDRIAIVVMYDHHVIVAV